MASVFDYITISEENTVMYTPPTIMNRVAELRIRDLTAEAQLARLNPPGHVPVRVKGLALAARMLRVEHQLLFDAPSQVRSRVARSAH
jgi:hypothetical protein